MPIIQNAKITSVMLGREDHGIMSAMLYLGGNGWGIGFGGYAMDQWDAEKKRRVGSDFGMEFIMAVLDVVGVDRWESLPGQFVRVEHESLGGGVNRIGHITDDKWFDPKALAESMKVARG